MKNISLTICIVALVFAAGCTVNPYKSGEVLYINFCSNCHGVDGKGIGDLYPPIAGSDYLKKHATSLSCMIRNGMDEVLVVNGKTYNEPMPPNPRLDEVAITNITNYINHAWPFREQYTTIIEIRSQLAACK